MEGKKSKMGRVISAVAVLIAAALSFPGWVSVFFGEEAFTVKATFAGGDMVSYGSIESVKYPESYDDSLHLQDTRASPDLPMCKYDKLYQGRSNPAKSGETLSALLSIIPGSFLLSDNSQRRGKSAFKLPDHRPDLFYFRTHKEFKMPICPRINTKNEVKTGRIRRKSARIKTIDTENPGKP